MKGDKSELKNKIGLRKLVFGEHVNSLSVNSD